MRLIEALEIVYELAEQNALPFYKDNFTKELDIELYEESKRQHDALIKVRTMIRGLGGDLYTHP